MYSEMFINHLLNVLVIDKIENIINYNPIGPRFSNDILQVLMVYLTKNLQREEDY